MEVRRQTLAKALAAIFVFNLVFMGTGAYFAYQQSPERPKRIVGPQGDVLATNEDIVQGKQAFQQNGLMNLGSILGNGAYFGTDYTADAQERLVTNMRRYVARERYGTAYAELTQSKQAAVNSVVKRQLQNGDFGKTVQLTAAEAYAYKQVRKAYVERYYGGAPEHGIPTTFVKSKTNARRFADFAI